MSFLKPMMPTRPRALTTPTFFGQQPKAIDSKPADICLAVQTGHDLGSYVTYDLHQSVLVAHSHYFKQVFNLLPQSKSKIQCILPVGDPHGVFPHLMKYMYTKTMDVDEMNVVYMCDLAITLGMAQVVHQCKEDLQTVPTNFLIDRLKVAYHEVKSERMVVAIISVLARRVHDKAHWSAFTDAPVDIMEAILRNQLVEVKLFDRLPYFIEKYIYAREQLHGEKVDFGVAKRLRNIASQLLRLRDLLSCAEGLLKTPAEMRKKPPYQLMHELKDSFYGQLRNADLETFSFSVPSPLEQELTISPPTTPMSDPNSNSNSYFFFSSLRSSDAIPPKAQSGDQVPRLHPQAFSIDSVVTEEMPIEKKLLRGRRVVTLENFT